MKKLSFLAAALAVVSIVACGPSKEEMEAKEKAKQDSIAAAEAAAMEQARQDSMRAAEEAAMKAKEDSMAAAALAAAEAEKAAASKGPKKPKKKEETSKPGEVKVNVKGAGTETKVNVTKKGGN